MDNGIVIAIIAVCGTLAGALVSTLGTYFIQNIRYKRETEREKGKEKTQIRRELISKRLSVVEEASTLMMFITGVAFDKQYGEGSYCDQTMLRKKRQRIEEIYLEAHTSSKSIESKTLSDSFEKIASKYWETDYNQTLTEEDYDIISSNYKKVREVIDDLIVNA